LIDLLSWTADLIAVIKDRVVQEEGTHEEVMKLEGLY
jgi:ABC-type transport system involved in Fe-S cluster assembly fused permease/ATPase subunit